MRRSGRLQRIERPFDMRRSRGGRHGRQQQSIEQLLRDDLERRAELRGDGGRGEPLVDMERPRDGARKQQFAREQVHLDFAALPASIIDNPIHSDW